MEREVASSTKALTLCGLRISNAGHCKIPSPAIASMDIVSISKSAVLSELSSF
jgi:hypothetical protein